MASIANEVMQGLRSGYGFVDQTIETARADREYKEQRALKESQKAAGLTALEKLGADATPEDRLEAVASARADEALRAGDLGNFTQHFSAAANMREFKRGRALERADKAFAASGDYNAYLGAYNELRDGIELKSIRRAERGAPGDERGSTTGNKFELVYARGGREEKRVVDEDALKGILGVLRDPVRAREIELANALESHKAALKRAEKTHDTNEDIRKTVMTDPGKRIVKVGKDETAINVDTGATFTGSGAGGDGRPRGGLTKEQLSVLKAIEDHARENYGESLGNMPGPRSHTTESTRLTNIGTELYINALRAGVDLTPPKAVEIAKNGKIGRATVRLPDGNTAQVPAVQYEGKVYPIGELPTPAQRPSPAGFPRVSPQEQATRDGDRVRVLREKLAAEQAKLAAAANEDARAQIEQTIAGLKRELARATQSAPTPAAPAAAPVTPASVAAQGGEITLSARDRMAAQARLNQLLAQREAMLKARQDTTELDAAIGRYVRALGDAAGTIRR